MCRRFKSSPRHRADFLANTRKACLRADPASCVNQSSSVRIPRHRYSGALPVATQTPHDNYRALVVELGKALKPRGFRKRGDLFGLRRGDDWGVVDLQKHSLATTRESVSFAINIGSWFRAFEDDSRRDPPAITDVHWRSRIGGEPPEEDERWWIIDDETELARLVALVLAAIEDAMPVLERHMNQALIVDKFLRGKNADLLIPLSYRARLERLAAAGRPD